MDIAVSMPDQIFVNASVIDSVWGGELQVKDAPDGFAVSGTIRPRRGYLSFIGKKFRLTDEGRIELDGVVPASPSMNISAEYSRSDIVAQLALTGKLNNPKYTLTSTPAMPEDEVLSHVLFGRDTSSISPYQAYQIAAAARQLSGGMNGPGFMYQMRQALSIDTLEWREPDTVDGTSSVAAGKYVTPGLYVEVNSTLENKEGSTGMMAEYEITRHFSVETSTGPQMRPGIGLNWKNDY
jgi:translocation and assembly module TamB